MLRVERAGLQFDGLPRTEDDPPSRLHVGANCPKPGIRVEWVDPEVAPKCDLADAMLPAVAHSATWQAELVARLQAHPAIGAAADVHGLTAALSPASDADADL